MADSNWTQQDEEELRLLEEQVKLLSQGEEPSLMGPSQPSISQMPLKPDANQLPSLLQQQITQNTERDAELSAFDGMGKVARHVIGQGLQSIDPITWYHSVKDAVFPPSDIELADRAAQYQPPTTGSLVVQGLASAAGLKAAAPIESAGAALFPSLAKSAIAAPIGRTLTRAGTITGADEVAQLAGLAPERPALETFVSNVAGIGPFEAAGNVMSVNQNRTSGVGAIEQLEKQTSPESNWARTTGVPRSVSNVQVGMAQQASMRNSLPAESPAEFMMRSDWYEKSGSGATTFDATTGKFVGPTADYGVDTNKPMFSDKPMDFTPGAIREKAKAASATASAITLERDLELRQIESISAQSNEKAITVPGITLSEIGRHPKINSIRDVSSPNSDYVPGLVQQIEAAKVSNPSLAEGMQEALNDFKGQLERAAVNNPTIDSRTSAHGPYMMDIHGNAVERGASLTDASNILSQLYNKKTEAGAYDAAPATDKAANPSLYQREQGKVAGYQNLIDALRDSIMFQLGGPTAPEAIRWNNRQTAIHSLAPWGAEADSYTLDPNQAQSMSAPSNIQNRQRPGLGASFGASGGAWVRMGKEGLDSLIQGGETVDPNMAANVSEGLRARQYATAARVSKLYNIEKQYGGRLPIDARLNILSGLADDANTAIAMGPLRKQWSNSSLADPLDYFGAGLVVGLRSDPPNIDKHHSLDRHVGAIGGIDPTIKAMMLLDAAGPLDAPALLQQEQMLQQPTERAKFWSAAIKRYPNLPFASANVTGLPSEFDDGTGPKLWDEQDKMTWIDTINKSFLREDVKAQLAAATLRNGTVYPMSKSKDLISLKPELSQPSGIQDGMVRQRTQGKPKDDLING